MEQTIDIHKKEVDFKTYCPKCEYYHLAEHKDPCHECLHYGWNENSKKPVRFKAK